MSKSGVAAMTFEFAGTVQGVGFRPFIYRLALKHRVNGWVLNRSGEVVIHAEGNRDDIVRFEHDSLTLPPTKAAPILVHRCEAQTLGLRSFRVLESEDGHDGHPWIPKDSFLCPDCALELVTPSNRRYRYPFIHCTQCGPRFSLIERLPYDRCNTSMRAYAPCEYCSREYRDPVDRRFHAEPVCCPACGPGLALRHADGRALSAGNEIATAIELLRAGAIVAVKGVGGYHLMCDALNGETLARLRSRKRRPTRPLAVMFPPAGPDHLDHLREFVDLQVEMAIALTGPERPIVLVPKAPAPRRRLPEGIAPGFGCLGVMLPSSPLHEVLLRDHGEPLVATSANLSGNPTVTDERRAETELHGIADAFLHHDRVIVRRLDDPIVTVTNGTTKFLRTGRGTTPTEIALPECIGPPVLAVGGHLKNTVCLAWDRRAVLSAHIGDLNSPGNLRAFERVIRDLTELYGVEISRVVCDYHSGYASSQWAQRCGLPVETVLHHHAHASALAAEYGQTQELLVFTWDGVGLGDDATLWGGEVFHGRPGSWRRVARLRPFKLQGLNRAAREPWLSAAALCWDTEQVWPALDALDSDSVVHRAWERDLNCFTTSAAGRLFDAASALVINHCHSSFEGEGPMRLEVCAAPITDDAPLLAVTEIADGFWEIDWRILVPMLLDSTLTPARRASEFHASLARTIVELSSMLRARLTFTCVGLTGGVFQNRLLSGLAREHLVDHGFDVVENRTIPGNDAGISVGQIMEYLGRRDG